MNLFSILSELGFDLYRCMCVSERALALTANTGFQESEREYFKRAEKALILIRIAEHRNWS